MDEVFDLDEPLELDTGGLELELDVDDGPSLQASLAEDRFRRGEDIPYQLWAPFDIEVSDNVFWEGVGKRIKDEVVKAAIAAADPSQPRWTHVKGDQFVLTEHGREFFGNYQRLIKDRFATPREAHKAGKPVTIDSAMAPRDHGSPEGLPTRNIVPDPAKSILPLIPLHEPLSGIRKTCAVCQACHGSPVTPHDCKQFQI